MFAFYPGNKRLVAMAGLLTCGAVAFGQQADTVLVHGTVLTEDARDSVAQALAIRGGAIVAVGTDAAVMKLAGPKTRVIDLKGRTATPGMIDTHSHYAEAGASDLFQIQLADVTSMAEIVSLVQQRVATAKPGEWIVGRGWDEGKLKEQRYVYAADLDGVSPKNPVLMVNTSGHYSTVNHMAMQLAGITEAITNPANGVFDRDSSGHLTGVMKEGRRGQ
jgi:predicted amidohydrolase YtcJ